MNVSFIYGYRFTLETAKKLYPEYFISGDLTDDQSQFEKIATEVIKKKPAILMKEFDADDIEYVFGVLTGSVDMDIGDGTLYDVPTVKGKNTALLDEFVTMNPLFASLKRRMMFFDGDSN